MEGDNLIPENVSGKKINAKSFREFSDLQLAKKQYEKAKSLLQDVNHWNETGSEMLASFRLYNESGIHLDTIAKQGLFIQIDIPGPGSADGDGFDWVRIEQISETNEGDAESLAIKVRPVAAPASAEDRTAHFYSDQSTSTFVVSRTATTLKAAVYDRNVEVNEESDSLIGKIRNVITGFMAKEGFSKIQWQSLTDGLVG